MKGLDKDLCSVLEECCYMTIVLLSLKTVLEGNQVTENAQEPFSSSCQSLTSVFFVFLRSSGSLGVFCLWAEHTLCFRELLDAASMG